MAAEGALVDTLHDQEINDPLYKFLISKNEQLRIKKTEINQQIFLKLKADDIILNDFLISHEMDLKDILKESGIKSKYIPRIIAVMFNVHNSQIYKDKLDNEYNQLILNQNNIIQSKHAQNNIQIDENSKSDEHCNKYGTFIDFYDDKPPLIINNILPVKLSSKSFYHSITFGMGYLVFFINEILINYLSMYIFFAFIYLIAIWPASCCSDGWSYNKAFCDGYTKISADSDSNNLTIEETKQYHVLSLFIIPILPLFICSLCIWIMHWYKRIV